MLLRFQSEAAGGLLAEMEKLTNLVTKLGQGGKLGWFYPDTFLNTVAHIPIVSYYDIYVACSRAFAISGFTISLCARMIVSALRL